MVITWYGNSCFKIQSGAITLVTDPFSKETGMTPPRFKADIVTVSHKHTHLQSESIPENPVIIEGPGEYEVKGVMVRGIETAHDAVEGRERGLNTIFVFELEDMKLVHMGDIGEEKLKGETVEALGTVDILFVPVGGGETIDGKMAKKIVDQIEPRIVVPMNFKIPEMKTRIDPVDGFLKEMGIKQRDAEDRLTIKKKELPQSEETKVVVLKTE